MKSPDSGVFSGVREINYTESGLVMQAVFGAHTSFITVFLFCLSL